MPKKTDEREKKLKEKMQPCFLDEHESECSLRIIRGQGEFDRARREKIHLPESHMDEMIFWIDACHVVQYTKYLLSEIQRLKAKKSRKAK